MDFLIFLRTYSSDSRSGWREKLLEASFRGVPFKVEEESAGTGRRVETHEYRHWMGTGTVGVMIASSDLINPIPEESTETAARQHIGHWPRWQALICMCSGRWRIKWIFISA